MRIAVTGASGFIGRHVLAELQRHDVEVVAAARDPARLPPASARLTPATLDLAEPPSDPFAALGRPDALIHLAWAGLPNYWSLHHFETELPRQFRFLKSMVEGGLGHMVVSGTCFEYGRTPGQLSEDLPAAPVTPYGHAKDSLRVQLEFLRRGTAFSFCWARLFYLYGEGQAPNSLFPGLRAAVARGDAAFPMSGGEQLRDFLPVEEVARLLVDLALRGAHGGVVNICSGRPVSVRRLVEGWRAELGSDIALALGHYPYPEYEPMAFWGDRRRLDGLLVGTAPTPGPAEREWAEL